ncbi:MAG TPA: class I SAM-dependent methyltransferase [Ktedonobacterales bacterium]|nr:class I SAM-dependent methyltransferase [Ktedonobacterales bacterium]
MDTALQALLGRLESEGQRHDQGEPEHDRRMLNLERATAEVLALWIRSSHRRSVLEIGTSNGYSTLWLAWAVQPAGGRVTSIDRSAAKHALADANLREAGLRDVVELAWGEGAEVIARLDGPFDAVFFDADRYSAPAQLELLMPKLAPDVLLFADNARSHPQEIAGYLAAVKALSGFVNTIIPVGKGLSVAYRAGAAPGDQGR